MTSKVRLPSAEAAYPTCGACQSETYHAGDSLRCEPCRLSFDPTTLEASRDDEDEPTCDAPCDNTWHGPDLIKEGWSYSCTPCQLTLGHESPHWTACRPEPTEPS